MSAMPVDLLTVALILGVALVFGLYFWHTAREIGRAAKMLHAFAERRAERHRQSAEAEAGRESLLRRAGQILSISMLCALLVYIVIRKFGLV